MSVPHCHSDLLDICQRVKIEADRISFASEEFLLKGALDALSHAQLLDTLTGRLYKNFYIRPESGRDNQLCSSEKPIRTPISIQTDIAELVAQLKIANGTHPSWDPGWEIYHFGNDGRAYVKRADQSRIAWAGTYMLDNWMGAGAKVGDIVKLKVFPYTEAPLDSFFHTFGATLSDQFDEYKLLRFYFNIESSTVVALLRFLSQQLNHYYIPYHFKALADPATYGRADAAVLYVASCHYQIVAYLLTRLPDLLGDGLRSGVPMFTREFARGIGAAQDPGKGASFGMHRCGLVALALLKANANGIYNCDGKMALIEQCFSDVGIDLNTPYLNSGEFDLFAQPLFVGGVE